MQKLHANTRDRTFCFRKVKFLQNETLLKGVLGNFCKDYNSHHRFSLQRCSIKKDVLRNFVLLKQRRWHRCFPVNFTKFLRTPFLQNTSGGLLLSSENFLKMAYLGPCQISIMKLFRDLRSSSSELFLGKGLLKILSKFTTDTHAKVWFQ